MEIVNKILLGAVFEILFITVMICRIKGLKRKKILFFISVYISYFLSGVIIKFNYGNQYLAYILMNLFIWIFMKLIYKKETNLVDLFIIYYVIMFVNFSCLIMMKTIGYNLKFLYLNRLVLTMAILLSNKLNKAYKFYLHNWNRNKDNKVKSVTTRNLTIISSNLALYIINYYVLNYLIHIIQ